MAWIDDKRSPAMPASHVGVQAYLGVAPTGRYDSEGHGRRDVQAFLVESGPDNPPLRTHFHTVNQFQYIAGGGGTVGRHDVVPGVVHYADRYTPYGPLRTGPHGLAYLTLRATTDMGISYMPDERDDLAESLDRHQIVATARRNITVDLTGDASDDWVGLVTDDDGLCIAVATVPRDGDRTTGPAAGAGAFAIVVSGELRDDDGTHGTGSLSWCPRGSSLPARATAMGARIAWLQLPENETR